jgi:type IV pilus assembly protein PilW
MRLAPAPRSPARRRAHVAARRAQRGLSPVEIMVGLVISLLIVGGLGHLVMGSRETGRVERNLLQMQESGRVAVEMIARELRKTGYRTERVLPVELVFPPASPFGTAGAVLSGADTSLTQRWVGSGDSWMRSCLGNDVAAGAMVVQTLSVADGELRCRARNLATGSDQTQPLLNHIEAVQLRYGIDTDGDDYADRYVAAAGVGDWTRVASIDVRLRTVSGEDFLTPQAQPYTAFDGSVVTPEDRRLRRSYATVVALRNRLP